MKRIKMGLIFFEWIIFGIGIFLIPTDILAVDDYLIKVGTGNNEITITEKTTVSEIVSVLGEAKLETISLFGGHSYTFYTDDNYSNYLYIETTSEDKIISFGSVDPSYSTPKYSYGGKYNYTDNTYLGGVQINDDGTIRGGIYYNLRLFSSNRDLEDIFKENYKKYETEYLKSLAEHSVLMFNAVRTNMGYPGRLIFDEDIFYTNEQLKEHESNIINYLFNISKVTNYMTTFSTKENVDLKNNYYFLNPIQFAHNALSKKNTDFTNTHLDRAVFSYEPDKKYLRAAVVSSDALDRIPKVEWTSDEKQKLIDARTLYKKAEENLRKDKAIYEIGPSYDKADSLVAGKLMPSKRQAVLDFMNAVRVGGGLPMLENRDHNFEVAQNKATLIAYRKYQLGLDMDHTFPKPDGVTDEFYNVSMAPPGNSYGENLYQSNYALSTDLLFLVLQSFLDDTNERNGQMFSHRQKMLDPKMKYFGFGIAQGMGSNEFSGTNSNDIEVVAWPSKGVTLFETLESPNFHWTVQFLKRYKVLDTTTAKVKCLNTNQEWIFDKQETRSTHKYKNITNGLSSLNNKVVIYHQDITPRAGYVYEITLYGIQDEITNTTVNYTYRSAFENGIEEKIIQNLKILVPSTLEKDSKTNSYKVYQNEIVKLNAVIDDTSVLQKRLYWTSSDPSTVSVTQNGITQVLKPSSTPVTITVSNPEAGVLDTVRILPQNISLVLSHKNYQFESLDETLKMSATTSNGNMTEVS